MFVILWVISLYVPPARELTMASFTIEPQFESFGTSFALASLIGEVVRTCIVTSRWAEKRKEEAISKGYNLSGDDPLA